MNTTNLRKRLSRQVNNNIQDGQVAVKSRVIRFINSVYYIMKRTRLFGWPFFDWISRVYVVQEKNCLWSISQRTHWTWWPSGKIFKRNFVKDFGLPRSRRRNLHGTSLKLNIVTRVYTVMVHTVLITNNRLHNHHLKSYVYRL